MTTGVFRYNSIDKIKIKICGITRVSDICLCEELGINAVGFLVKDVKPTYQTDILLPDEAKLLISQVPSSLISVLLIKYTKYDKICRLIDDLKPAAIQIQEEEISPETVELLRKRYDDIEFIKTIHIEKNDSLENVRSKVFIYTDFIDAILLDSKQGGSGETHNWKISSVIAEELKKKEKSCVLAGGLNESNLKKAITEVKPDLVDIMTGAQPFVGGVRVKGVLDPIRVEQLAEIINQINSKI